MFMKHKKALIISLISVGSVIGLLLSFIGGVLIFASATTLKVKDSEKMAINGNVTAKIDKANQLSLLTWNTGYGALDERQDCYWDGGKGVYSSSFGHSPFFLASSLPRYSGQNCFVALSLFSFWISFTFGFSPL